MDNSDQRADEAIGWVIRLRDGDTGDWEAFTRWLEADSANLAAYEKAALIDEAVGPLLERGRPATAPLPPPRRAPLLGRRAALGWAVAAAFVGMLGFGMLQSGNAERTIETGPGERRAIALADGSRIALNGSSRIMLDSDDPRYARLERGEALFDIAHDPARRFRVEAGEATIRNLGTRFNVVHERELLRVEVAEGAVLFQIGDRELSLARGESVRRDGNRLVVGRRDPAEVGVWQRGYLSYSSATIAEIAADLSRSSGISVRADPQVAQRRFTGVIMLDEDRERLLRRLSALLAVRARRSGEAWVLTPEAG